MYEYLTGKITAVTPTYIVVEVAGVGYLVTVANPFSYQEGTNVTIFIHQIVRENELTLYGFADKATKTLFVRLLDVSGIGPKSALAILASQDHQGLVAAINNDDVGYLTKFPGVGKKTAAQMVLDLKGKVKQVSQMPLTGQTDLRLPSDDAQLNDALQALEALGYSKTEIKRIKPKLTKINAKSTDEYLRSALSLLLQK